MDIFAKWPHSTQWRRQKKLTLAELEFWLVAIKKSKKEMAPRLEKMPSAQSKEEEEKKEKRHLQNLLRWVSVSSTTTPNVPSRLLPPLVFLAAFLQNKSAWLKARMKARYEQNWLAGWLLTARPRWSCPKKKIEKWSQPCRGEIKKKAFLFQKRRRDKSRVKIWKEVKIPNREIKHVGFWTFLWRPIWSEAKKRDL